MYSPCGFSIASGTSNTVIKINNIGKKYSFLNFYKLL